MWKDKAAEENAAAAIQNAEGDEKGDAAADEEAVEEKDEGPSENLLPLSLVKKIALSDPDNSSRISAEGLVAVAKATDVLLGLLVQGSAKAAKAQKRRTIQLKDFVSALKMDKRLAVIGLKDIEGLVKAKSEADASAKAVKVAEARDRSTEEVQMLEKDNEAENKDPSKALPIVMEGKGGKDKGGGEGEKKKRGRPANDGEKRSAKAGAKKAKAEEEASKGTRKIDAFFTKATKVREKAGSEVEEVD